MSPRNSRMPTLRAGPAMSKTIIMKAVSARTVGAATIPTVGHFGSSIMMVKQIIR